MTVLIWTGVAAVTAFLGNRVLYAMLGRRAAWLAVPWLEEAVKFMTAGLLAGRSLLGISCLFGGAELLYDLLTSRTNGLFLGLLSLCTHGLAGGVAILLWDVPGGWCRAFLAAGLIHMAVNLVVVRLVLPALGAEGARQRI